jgi:predicted ATP-dependent endonuclease of OLD family
VSDLKLISVEVLGYRRLVKIKVNLTGKLIAIVGPNEAGKTSLLHALERLDKGDAVPPQDISRAAGQVDPQEVYLKAEYLLDEDDQVTFSDLEMTKTPVRMSYKRRVGGDVPLISFEPSPARPRTRFDRAMRALKKADLGAARTMISGPSLIVDGIDSAFAREARPLDEGLQEILPLIADENNILDDTIVGKSDAIAEQLDRINRRDLGSQLRSVVQWRLLPEISKEIYERIYARIPRFLLFSEADRNLLNEYDIQGPVASNPPPALANVARLAQLNLKSLLVAIEGGNDSRVFTMLGRANRELARVFNRSWRQSVITLELHNQGTVLKMMIKENGDIITRFDERSAGLRMFVALAAFVASADTLTPPVLLIDEAEVHLHYDAQADLINMLLTQKEAAQVIYTTHSPGCLPLDLGTGIRVIAPIEPGKTASEVRNAFWTDHNAGFSPLLLAMGAGAAAFTATRFAILAEGPSEMILLPSLIRAATGLDSLPYQVAPGLSEAPTSQYPDLDLNAARVAFVVDGDHGGSELKKRLMNSGVPEERIAVIRGMTLEDTVDLNAYVDAVHAEAVTVNAEKADVARMPADMFSLPRASSVRTWYKRARLIAPSKIAVANRLVQDGRALPSEEGCELLQELHNQVVTVLGINIEEIGVSK